MNSPLAGYEGQGESGNTTMGQPVKFEFQINTNFFKYKYVPVNIRDILILKKITHYLSDIKV